MIPVCEPLLAGKEIEYVINAVRSNWISSQGRYVEEFEEKFAAYCGCRYGITTTNGTTALHLALATLGIREGDEVIVPTYTMAATVMAIVYVGATPVLVDSECDTGNIDVKQIEGKITSRTKAVLPVHIYGHPCDMDEIIKIGRKYHLFIIEDAAEAHGAEYKGRRAGSMSDIGCFSFYANKIITTGEGGMIVTNNANLADQARRLKDLAHSKEERFVHTDIGFNFRMTNVQAAIGLAQLERIDILREMRRQNAYYYNSRLKSIPGIQIPTEREWAKSVYWMYAITIKNEFGLSRNQLMDELKKRDIQTRAFFIPMHLQPCFLNMGLFKGETYPIAEDLGQRGLYLPSGSGLTKEQKDYICDSINLIRFPK